MHRMVSSTRATVGRGGGLLYIICVSIVTAYPVAGS